MKAVVDDGLAAASGAFKVVLEGAKQFHPRPGTATVAAAT